MFHVYAHGDVTVGGGRAAQTTRTWGRGLWYKRLQPLHPKGCSATPTPGLHAYYYYYYTRLRPVLRGVPTRCPPMNSYVPWLSPLCPPMNSGVKHGLGCACRAASQLSGVALHHL